MIRAAFITPALYWGGAERWMITLAEYTRDKIDWQGCAVIYETNLTDSMVRDMARLMPVWGYGQGGVKKVSANADVIVSWGISKLGQVTEDWRAKERGPLVFVGHGSGQFDRNAMKASGNAASHWAVVSEACVPAIQESLPGVDVEVVENGIDPKRCIRSERSREDVRRELGVEPDEFLVGYFGRIVPEKNPVGLARGLACLPEKYRGVWIGDGYDKDHQRDLIRQVLPAAVFVERVDEHIADYLNAFDLFALVSPAEGFSLCFLEACYVGVPVIITPVGVMPQLEARYGRHWASVPTDHTPYELAEMIRLVSQWTPEERKATTGAAKKIVEENFLACHMADRWHKYLVRIVEEWRHSHQPQLLWTGDETDDPRAEKSDLPILPARRRARPAKMHENGADMQKATAEEVAH